MWETETDEVNCLAKAVAISWLGERVFGGKGDGLIWRGFGTFPIKGIEQGFAGVKGYICVSKIKRFGSIFVYWRF